MTLTEKWKKGELEQGEYWCKITESPYVERVYLPCCDDIIVEVLAPVPSYQEYLESEAHCAVYSEVNKRLEKKLEIAVNAIKTVIKEEGDNIDGGMLMFLTEALAKIKEIK